MCKKCLPNLFNIGFFYVEAGAKTGGKTSRSRSGRGEAGSGEFFRFENFEVAFSPDPGFYLAGGLGILLQRG